MKMRAAWLGALSLLLGFSLLGLRGISVRAQDAPRQERRVSPPRPPIAPPIIGHPIDEPPIWPRRPWPQPLPVLGQELKLQREAAKVEISNGVARTRLTQTFRNSSNRTIEGTYVFPLPSGAAVTGFAMMMNGKRVEAEILEGDRAREIYTGIVQKMRDPAILEFIDRNLLRARIFPIPAGAEQQVELEYSESLKADSSAFRYVVPLRLPTGGAAQSASVEIKLRDASGLRAIYSPTHEIEIKRGANSATVTGEFGSGFGVRRATTSGASKEGADRDFVLYFTRAQNRVGLNMVTYRTSDEDGYFMLLAAPDAQIEAREIAAKDVVFVCDTSGSMSGEKIEQTKKALQTLLGNLNPNDRFNIITFSSDTRSFRDAMVMASAGNLEGARKFAREIKAVGGTNINDALIESVEMLRESGAHDGRPAQIVFMTDGQPTVGETDIAQIMKNVRQKNEVQAISGRKPEADSDWARLFTFGVGYDVNTRLLDTLAEDNRGASDYVLPEEDIEQKVGALYARIAYPVMTNPRLDWSGLKVYDIYPKRLPDLFKGSQVVVFGRYEGSGSGARVQLVGNSAGKSESVPGVVDFGGSDAMNDSLPRLWATRKVGYLLDDARREGRTLDPEVRDEVIKLSKRYGIVTPLTAGLITEDGEQPVDRLQNTGVVSGVSPGMMRNRARRQAGAAEDSAFGARAAAPSFAPAPATGAAAVAASKATGDLRARQTLRDTQGVRNIESKTFYQRDGVWTDGAYDVAKSSTVQAIKFASPEYFALLKDARIAKWLSVGERVLIVLPAQAGQPAKTIRIEP